MTAPTTGPTTGPAAGSPAAGSPAEGAAGVAAGSAAGPPAEGGAAAGSRVDGAAADGAAGPAAASRRWLAGVEIPADDIEGQLLRCLGCWAADVVTGVPAGQPGDRPLRRLLDLPPFAAADYRGDPVLALAMHAGLHRRGLAHASLDALAGTYARAVGSTPGHTPGLDLVRALLHSAGLPVPAPADRDRAPDWRLPAVDDRPGLLDLCRVAAVSSIWGSRPVRAGGAVDLLPQLALSWAMDWDLAAVCALLRTCAYLGLSDRPGCRWAVQWLLDQHSDDRFGLILRECQLAGTDPAADSSYLAGTVDALWTLAELRQPGFLLGPPGDRPALPGDRLALAGDRPGPAGDRLALAAERPGSSGDRLGPADDRLGPAGDWLGPAGDWLGSAGDRLVPAGGAASLAMRLRPVSESRVAGRRIGAGTPAPPICLVDVFTGGTVSLAAFRGRQVLVVFVTADCAPCDDVIAGLVRPARPDGPQVLLVSRGGAAATRHKLAGYDIDFPVVVQDRWEISRRYGAFSFPAAVLVDEAGVVARDMFRADEIPALLATPEFTHPN